MIVDRQELENLLADRLKLASLRLLPIGVKCAAPVFRGESAGAAPVFVKVVAPETARRALRVLRAAQGCELLPRPVLREPVDYRGRAVTCLEWKESSCVEAERMTDAQLAGFLDGCRRLSDALQGCEGEALQPDDEDSPVAQYAALQRFDRRHPLAGRLLRPLLGIPAAERCYGGRKLVVIHGDLQPKNYGFSGDDLSAVYDTDDLTLGLACEDAVYAFAERARRSALTVAERRRLVGLFRRLVAESPWPRDEWRIAVNHARLRIAARRIASHPASPFIALDVLRRDRGLRVLADALETGPC